MSLASLVILSACQRTQQVTQTSATSTQSQTKKHMNQTSQSTPNQTIASTSVTSEAKQADLWNEAKATKLQRFMVDWGNDMGQTYKEYTPDHSVNYYGIQLPERLINGDVPLLVDKQTVPVQWSETGNDGTGYQLVAVYADVETANGPDLHCYLFTIYNGQPVVLIGQHKGYYQYGTLDTKETENVTLKAGFAQIVDQQRQTTNKTKETKEISINKLTYEEAKSLVSKEIMPFDDNPGHLVTETPDYPFTKGGHAIELMNGGMILRQLTGARGFEEYTLTPNADGTVRIVWETSTINQNQRVGVAVAKDVTVKR